MRGSRSTVMFAAALACGSAQAQLSVPNHLSEVQVERLAAVGRLWGTVKLFHPWLPTDHIDWDQALVRAIPLVKSANSPEEFRTAVDTLLSFLEDPLTRASFVDEETPGPDAGAAPPALSLPPPSLRWPRDGTALISIPDFRAFADPGISAQFAEITEEAAKAEAVIFDLRIGEGAGLSDLSEYEVWPLYEPFQSSLLSFIQGEIPTPSFRYRMHTGRPGLSTFVLTQQRALRGQARRPYRVVLMADERLISPARSLFLGLESVRAVYTIIEGEKAPEAPARLCLMPLTDEVVAHIRVSDRVGMDGLGQLRPDKIIAPSEEGTQGVDQVLHWALEAADGNVSLPVGEEAGWSPPPLALDKPYAAQEFPSEEHRLLALFRFWSTIQFFFPYIELMDHPWEGVLVEFVPKIMAATDAVEYHLTVSELVTRIQDSHGNVASQVLSRHFGARWPPVEVKWIENQTVVTNVLADQPNQTVEISRGDVVLAVDGEDIAALRERIAEITPASTPQSLHSRVHNRLFRGPEGSEARVQVLHEDGRIAEYSLKRTMGFPRGLRTMPVFDVLPEGYGYVDLERLRPSEVDKAFEAIRSTPAVIFDVRGNPQGTAARVAERLTSRTVIAAKLLRPEVHGMFIGGPVRVKHVIDQALGPGTTWRYEGKVVVLINEEAISQGEHTCLWLEAAAGPTFIGSPTAGADGTIASEALPGGIQVRFSGYGAEHGDGRQLQRIGIQPHVLVRPTIKGIRDGRDEVLERAVSYLQEGR